MFEFSREENTLRKLTLSDIDYRGFSAVFPFCLHKRVPGSLSVIRGISTFVQTSIYILEYKITFNVFYSFFTLLFTQFPYCYADYSEYIYIYIYMDFFVHILERDILLFFVSIFQSNFSFTQLACVVAQEAMYLQ